MLCTFEADTESGLGTWAFMMLWHWIPLTPFLGWYLACNGEDLFLKQLSSEHELSRDPQFHFKLHAHRAIDEVDFPVQLPEMETQTETGQGWCCEPSICACKASAVELAVQELTRGLQHQHFAHPHCWKSPFCQDLILNLKGWGDSPLWGLFF